MKLDQEIEKSRAIMHLTGTGSRKNAFCRRELLAMAAGVPDYLSAELRDLLRLGSGA